MRLIPPPLLFPLRGSRSKRSPPVALYNHPHLDVRGRKVCPRWVRWWVRRLQESTSAQARGAEYRRRICLSARQRVGIHTVNRHAGRQAKVERLPWQRQNTNQNVKKRGYGQSRLPVNVTKRAAVGHESRFAFCILQTLSHWGGHWALRLRAHGGGRNRCSEASWRGNSFGPHNSVIRQGCGRELPRAVMCRHQPRLLIPPHRGEASTTSQA